MDWINKLYVGFEGRLNRQAFWLGVIGLIVASIIVSFVLGSIFGVSMMPMMGAAFDPNLTPEQLSAMVATATRNGAWAGLVSFLILAYPALSLSIKRAHDRNSNGQLVYALFGLNALNLVLQALGISYGMTQMGTLMVPTPNAIGWILQAATGLLGLYLLVTLGFLKGTTGPNTYGPDPLGGTAPTAA